MPLLVRGEVLTRDVSGCRYPFRFSVFPEPRVYLPMFGSLAEKWRFITLQRKLQLGAD
jgi:hypothetical protein